MIHNKGAIHEIELFDFFTCTVVDGFTVAVDFVSAMTFKFFSELKELLFG